MLAAYLEKPYEIKIKEIPKPEIKNPDDLLIKVSSVGICGSDVHYYKEGRIGDFVVKKPLILGHETTGIVEEVGKKVKKFRQGDKVTLEPGIPCRKCKYCKEGKYNLCPYVKFFATPPVDGTFCEYVIHPEDFTYKLPENVSFEEGTLLEPFSVGLHASSLAKIKPGYKVLILGMGPVGLLAIQAVKAYGAEVFGVDRVKTRLNLAKELGASVVIDTTKINIEDLKEVLPEEPDVIFECSGVPVLIQESVNIVKRGGTIIFIGMGSDIIPLNVAKITAGEIEVKGLFRYANTYPTVIKLIEKGEVLLKPLISKIFSLRETAKALEYPGKNPECIKAIIKIS